MFKKTHAYLKIGHSIKQRLYVDWKYSILSPYVLKKPSAYKGNGTRIGYRFWTRSLPVFTEYYDLFYGESGKKRIPPKFELTPFALAIWFMDDGAQNRKSAYFNTQQFPVGEQFHLLDMLRSKFDLNGNINRDKTYFRIRLYQESAQKLKKIISPFMPTYMHYKLPL